MKTRLYFLDNLRTVLIFFVVLYHAAIVYQSGFEASWIVSDPVKAKSIGILGLIIDSFVMFTIFFISGYFIRYSVKNKSAIQFVKSKVKRIIIPWLLAVLTLIPAYKYIFLYSRNLSQESWETYFHFFEKEGSNLAVFANSPTQSWLWFLPVLFLFQLLYLFMHKTKVFNLKVSIPQAVIGFFIISIIYSKFIAILDLRGWTYSLLLDFQTERLLPYFLMFLFGALCNKLNVFSSYIRNRKTFIWANVLLSIVMTIYIIIALNYFFNIVYPERNYYFISKGLDSILYYSSSLLTTLSFLYLLVDVFALKFNKTSKLMTSLGRGSYNVYIIHMIVIGLIATPLIALEINTYLKFAIVSIASFIISHLIINLYQKIKNIMKPKQSIVTLLIASLLIISCKNEEQKSKNSIKNKIENSSMKPKMGIHEAVIRNDKNVILEYIKKGLDINEKDPKGGSSPLGTAITFNKEEIALLLINSGADLNSTSNDGSTPLHVAAFFGRTKIVEALLAKKVDISIRNKASATAYESVAAPFEMLKPIYDKLQLDLMPLGFKLDYKELEKEREIIANLLKN